MMTMEIADHGIARAIFPFEMPLQPEGISFSKTTQAVFDIGDFCSSVGNQFIIPGYTSADDPLDINDLVPLAPETDDIFRPPSEELPTTRSSSLPPPPCGKNTGIHSNLSA